MPQPPPIPNNRHIPVIAGASGIAESAAPPRRATVSIQCPAKDERPGRLARVVSREGLRNSSSFLTSVIVHTVVFIVLALTIQEPGAGHGGLALIVDISGDAETPVVPENLSINVDQSEWETAPVASSTLDPLQSVEVPEIPSPFAAPTVVAKVSSPTAELRDIPVESLLLRSSLPSGGGIEGRTQQQRSRLAGERGGSTASESAVELSLVWLAAHQRPDGSWRLKLDEAPSQCDCSRGGLIETRNGATALALLPFLGAGYSHLDGPYKDVVRKGLYFLTTQMRESPRGGDLHENVTMYSQGLATIALCEGYAMSDDENLRPFAQKAVDFICNAQHPRGGWRYVPGSPGDLTVTGWQVMALKSARLAKLHVPSQTTHLVSGFLDSVQEADGAFYGYNSPDKQPGTTAVGLLLRMYAGWEIDDRRLQRGAGYLAQLGPSKTDIYYDYYATQVMNHVGGSPWRLWNERMRDHLVATQSQSGHERGSWYFADRHGTVGGRLYTTAMAAMILEVYYRYMPLYGDDAVSTGF